MNRYHRIFAIAVLAMITLAVLATVVDWGPPTDRAPEVKPEVRSMTLATESRIELVKWAIDTQGYTSGHLLMEMMMLADGGNPEQAVHLMTLCQMAGMEIPVTVTDYATVISDD